MIIGVDIRHLQTSKLTGVGVYTQELLRHLLALDKQNSYCLFANSVGGLVPDFSAYHNVKIISRHWPNKLLNFALTFFNQPKIDKLIGNCDIFWFPNLNFWSISNSCKSIVTMHDLSFERLPWAYSAKMKLWHKVIKPTQKLQQSSMVITPSCSTKNDLMDLYNLPENKIKVIYPGISLPSLSADLSMIKQKYHLPEKFILFLGTLEPRKNIIGIIQAFELLKSNDYHLVIGGGRGWLYRQIIRRVKQSIKASQIHLIDYVDLLDRAGLYQLASLLVWPSFYEGFGFPPLEAMQAGCPVITSTNSSLPEVAGEAALLVDPYNIMEISQAISAILSDPDFRQRMIDKGKDLVKKYTWEKAAKELLDVFNNF